MSYYYLDKISPHRPVADSPDPAGERGGVAQDGRHVAGVRQDELWPAVLRPGLGLNTGNTLTGLLGLWSSLIGPHPRVTLLSLVELYYAGLCKVYVLTKGRQVKCTHCGELFAFCYVFMS